jgi:hypothetical protein
MAGKSKTIDKPLEWRDAQVGGQGVVLEWIKAR